MKDYLILSPTGRNSFVKEWVSENPNFDLVLLCYENDPEIARNFTQYTPHVYCSSGEKYHLIKSFIQNNLDFISKYKFIWLPDDDVKILSKDINELFNIANQYDLSLCQPSMKGYISHSITSPIEGNILRYTNFVEILAPLFSKESLLKLYNTFDLNFSSWGYDYLWPYLLDYPSNKIAIIDKIVMEHTKPVGGNYSRFPISPDKEMNILLSTFNITPRINTFTSVKI
jgi:hypothetical protein